MAQGMGVALRSLRKSLCDASGLTDSLGNILHVCVLMRVCVYVCVCPNFPAGEHTHIHKLKHIKEKSIPDRNVGKESG